MDDFLGLTELNFPDMTGILISKGYLPYELVPAFTTKKLADFVANHYLELKGINSVKKSSKYCVYSIPKVKHVRRLLAIPNPLHQIMLSKTIQENWEYINHYIGKSEISLSRPDIDSFSYLDSSTESRAVNRRIQLSDIPIYRANSSPDSRYLLKADISRFYPTLYTHIIPWALHTKELSKKNAFSKTKVKLYGDDLDDFVRKTQSNQTIGIPIGPDTSIILSEIIGTAIDIELTNRLKKERIKVKGFRFVDDYYLYFNNLADAQFALSTLHVILKDFELELNAEKTKIIELPDILEAKWVLELRQTKYQIGQRHELKNDELISYFSKAFELSIQYPDEAVLKYALIEIMDSNVEEEYWELYQSLLLKSVMAEPSVLPIVTEVLLAYKNLGYKLNRKKISMVMFELIQFHCQYSHTHEISWALWVCKTLRIKIHAKVAKEISKVLDSVVALIALDLQETGLIKKLDISNWRKVVNEDNLYSEFWLLAYEAMKKNWIKPVDGVDFLEKDPFFKLLKQNEVEFYEASNQVTPALIYESAGDPFVKQKKNKRKRRKRFY